MALMRPSPFSIQQSIAAVHVARLHESQRNDIIKTHGEKNHLSVMWRFFRGTLDFTRADAMNTFTDVIKTNTSLLFQLQCCYESQHSLACAHVISRAIHNLQGKLQLMNQRLTLTDCLAIGYALNRSDCSNIELDLSNADIGDAGAQVLGTALKNCTSIKVLK